MKILLSPVGKSDPHGKRDRDTGALTPASVLSICEITLPDTVILMPTEHAENEDTRVQAEETAEWIRQRWPQMKIEVKPVSMKAANDYEEALRTYGNALVVHARQYPQAKLLVNASSGTPAIKVACLLIIAEGRIQATPYYADDPTECRREDRVRPINITFLRESSLMQRICDLLRQGQFKLTQEPLEELEQAAYTAERRKWAAQWKHLCYALQCWDERDYKTACECLDKLISDWKEAPAKLKQQMQRQHEILNGLKGVHSPNGIRAWDLYFQAARLQARGQLAGSIIYLWIAMETVLDEYAERQCRVNTKARRYDMTDTLRELLDENRKNDITMQTLWQQFMPHGSLGDNFDVLKDLRNAIIHDGKVAVVRDVLDTTNLAQRWLAALGCEMPPKYPLAPEALNQLADIFNSDCGRSETRP